MLKSSNFFARRALLADLPEISRLCEQHRDFSYFTEKTARAIQHTGEGWCCVENGRITAFCGFLPAYAGCELCEACEKTRLFSPKSILILPVCAEKDFLARGRFLEWCLSRANGKNEVITALLPVKAGSAELALYFALGLCLTAMCPLYELRPYYIFSRGLMQISRVGAIMVSITDTHSISKFLEQGFCGTDIKEIDGIKHLEMVRLRTDS